MPESMNRRLGGGALLFLRRKLADEIAPISANKNPPGFTSVIKAVPGYYCNKLQFNLCTKAELKRAIRKQDNNRYGSGKEIRNGSLFFFFLTFLHIHCGRWLVKELR